MNINLKNIKERAMDKLNNISTNDILACTVGATIGLTVVCMMQQVQLSGLASEKALNIKRFKLATNNDFKAYNQYLTNSAAIDAIVNGLKATHPGIEAAVEEAIANAEYLDMPYPEV